MAWIDSVANESAASLRTRLDGLGACVNLSEDKSSSIVSASSNYLLRQIQVVTTFEYRGLTEAAAKKLRGCESDSSTNLTLYAASSATAKTKSGSVSATVKSGTVVAVSASRADESGKWTARFTQTQYSYSGSGWTQSVPSTSATGMVTSVKKSKIVNNFMVGNAVLSRKLQTRTVTTKEYNYLTKAQAESICANPTDNMLIASITLYDQNTEEHTFTYSEGTTVSFEMRYVDSENGWTVIETTETRGAV